MHPLANACSLQNIELPFRVALYAHLRGNVSRLQVEQLNRMNSEVLSIIRASNPSRTVLYGGLGRMNPKWLKANPDAMVLPSDR